MATTTKYPGIKRLSDGRYRLRVAVTDPRPGRDRIQRQETMPEGAKISEAVARREEVREEILREIQAEKMGEPRLAGIDTVGDFAVYWMEKKAPTLTHKTRKQYVRALEEHTLPYIQDVPAREITRNDVAGLVDAMDRATKSDGSPYSRATRRSWWRVAKQMLMDLAAELEIYDPTNRIRGPRVGGGKSRTRRTLTLPELVELVKLAGKLDDSQRTLEVMLLATTGMRVGELYGLKWSDLDYGAGMIRIRRTATEGKVRKYTKNKRERSAPMFPFVERRLLEHRKTLMGSELVCPSNEGTARFAGSIYKPLDRLSEAMGLEFSIRPQVLRRTYNTLMVDAGLDKIVTRAIMGHSNDKMTEHYAGIEDVQKHAATKRAFSPLYEDIV